MIALHSDQPRDPARNPDEGPAQWRVTVTEISDPSRIEARWRELERRSSCSFFQSWGWVGSWLETFPERRGALLLQAERNGEIVGLSVLGQNALSRLKLVSSRALLLSETGIPDDDALAVEHSGLLMQAGLESEIIAQCLAGLEQAALEWDEFYISGVEINHVAAYIEGAERAQLTPIVRADHPYFFVDLAALGSHRGAYLDSLSRNCRYQVRRALRAYETNHGPAEYAVAESCDQALAYFRDLKEMHQSHWEQRGYPGAFATRSSKAFHERLIRGRFDAGEIQLAQLRAGAYVFGYLYSFVFDGVVSNYQSGFRYEQDPKIKPGLVGHTLAVQHNHAAGNRIYDFLVGDQRFKRSLATHEARMMWLVLQKNRWRFRVENGLRSLRARFSE